MVATSNDNEIIIGGKGKTSISAKYIFTENFVVRVSYLKMIFCIDQVIACNFAIQSQYFSLNF